MRSNWVLCQVSFVMTINSETEGGERKLTAEMYTWSARLRTWCEQNRNRYYIPEWLLAEWCITVDASFSGSRPYPSANAPFRSQPHGFH